MLKKAMALFSFCLLLIACRQAVDEPAAAPTPIPPPAPGTVRINADLSWGPISPYLLGSNYGPWIAVPVDMLPAAYESGAQAIRFPGGAWGDRNDLKPYHIDPFIEFCKQVGAMPVISVRLREGSPEQAADLVRYVNIEKQYGVKYWIVGNEPALYAAELQVAGKADDYDTVQHNAEWRAIALAMKAVDPTIQLLGPETHQFNHDINFNPKDSSGRDWMIEFLKANGDLVDVVTFHRYPFPRRNDDIVTVEDLRQHTLEWDKSVPYLRQLIAEHTGRDLPVALTEVNTHWNNAVGGVATPDSHYNALWVAEMYGRLMRQDVMMVNHWMLTSHGGYGGWGLIGRGELRPSYYVFQLYKQFGTELLYAESGVQWVSVYAARRDDGAVTVLLLNLADAAQDVKLQLTGTPIGSAQLWRLDPENNPDAAAPFSLGDTGTMTLPGQSISLLVLFP
ncbi:MAG: hypothetical protein KJ063_20210 [Anaerolineae bacterium]|nr:hypothetical protein [Anaerolineae bacterium]